MVYGWREGAKWGFFAPLYSLAGPQNRIYFDLSDSLRRVIPGNWTFSFRESTEARHLSRGQRPAAPQESNRQHQKSNRQHCPSNVGEVDQRVGLCCLGREGG